MFNDRRIVTVHRPPPAREPSCCTISRNVDETRCLLRPRVCQEKVLDTRGAFVYPLAGMEKIVEQTLLYDFYGELLTEHQREVYEDVVLGDLGYSEAALEYGVSRQGVHDLVKRVDHQLREYEKKLGLVERFLKVRSEVTQIRQLAGSGTLDEKDTKCVAGICDRILSQL